MPKKHKKEHFYSLISMIYLLSEHIYSLHFKLYSPSQQFKSSKFSRLGAMRIVVIKKTKIVL